MAAAAVVGGFSFAQMGGPPAPPPPPPPETISVVSAYGEWWPNEGVGWPIHKEIMVGEFSVNAIPSVGYHVHVYVRSDLNENPGDAYERCQIVPAFTDEYGQHGGIWSLHNYTLGQPSNAPPNLMNCDQGWSYYVYLIRPDGTTAARAPAEGSYWVSSVPSGW